MEVLNVGVVLFVQFDRQLQVLDEMSCNSRKGSKGKADNGDRTRYRQVEECEYIPFTQTIAVLRAQLISVSCEKNGGS